MLDSSDLHLLRVSLCPLWLRFLVFPISVYPRRSAVRFCFPSSVFLCALCGKSFSFPISAITVLSSITSSGHSSQLCSQQTIASQPFGSCPCFMKFLLSCSSSILTRCSLSLP